jgi:hypothetical protein
MRWVVLLAIAACSGGRGAGITTTTGSGSAQTGTPATCDGVRARVEQLYRAEAQQREAKRVDEAVADNTAMAMNDCEKQPARVAPCLARAGSVPELEASCLIPLDEEGSEGELIAR